MNKTLKIKIFKEANHELLEIAGVMGKRDFL